MTNDGGALAGAVLEQHRQFWFARVAAALGVSPTVLALLVAGAIAGLTPVIASLAGHITYERRRFEVFVPYLVAVAVLVSMIGLTWTTAWAERALAESRRHLAGSEVEFDRAHRSLAHYRPGALWLAGVVMAVWVLPFHEYNTQRWSRFLEGDWNAFDVWVVLIVTGVSVAGGQAFLAIVLCARSLGRTAEEQPRGRPRAPAGSVIARRGR